jgi:hypothetical protein
MGLAQYEVPVAYSMVKLAMQFKADVHPFGVFTCYWAAFNNVYVTIADQKGRKPQLRANPDGSPRTRAVGHVKVPQVDSVSEREQLDLVVQQFTADLKRRLVEHASTSFFAYRTPHWRGQPIRRDANGQLLNGVLNVGHTIDAQHPVWTPIAVPIFEEYIAGARDQTRLDALVRQILNVLYTIRNNAFHGGKRSDDANDQEVLQQALPLLIAIVESFVQVRHAG